MNIHNRFGETYRFPFECCGQDNRHLRILYPEQCARLDFLTEIIGRACPCDTVKICIDNLPALETTANRCGEFRVDNPFCLCPGWHRMAVTSGENCEIACVSFLVESCAFCR